MLLIRKLNTQLHKRVRQLFYLEDSIYVDELQVTKQQIAEMEEIINSNNIVLDFSKSYFQKIKENLESASTQNSIYFCFLNLQKIIEIPNNPHCKKQLIDSEEIILKESLEVIADIQQEKDCLYNFQESQSFQSKCEPQTELFEAIHFFVKIIYERLTQDPEFMENTPLAKPVLYDIIQIYLIYYLRLYRIYIEANTNKFLPEYYQSGQNLFRLACNYFNEYQTQNLFNLLYNFRTVSILAIILENKLEYIEKIMQDFLNYHYLNEENMEKLFKYEQTLNSTIFDYCLSISNQKTFIFLFQEVLNLDKKFTNNCHILELKCLLFSRYLSSNFQEEELQQCVENHINNSKSWRDQLLRLISFGSKRLLKFFINLDKFENNNEILRNWQKIIIDIINSCFKIEPGKYYDQDFIEQLFTFILNSLKHIQKYNQIKNKSSDKILLLLEDSINHALAKEQRFQKKLLDILIFSDVACDKFQNYIFNVVSPSSFTSDPINTAKYIQICNQSVCRQKIINHIYCSFIRYKKINSIDSRTNLSQKIQQLQQMIIYFEKEKKINENVKFLCQQIRFGLRLILTNFVINHEQLQQENNDYLLNKYPLLFLEKSFLEIGVNFDVPSRNTFDLSCALHISQYLMKILELANKLQNCQLEDLYDILICLLKLIQAIQKFLYLNYDIIAVNQFFDNIDLSFYKFMVKVLIHHQQLQQSQMKYVIDNMQILIFEDNMNKNMSTIVENTKKYLNYHLIKIFLSVIFECQLPSEYKKLIVDGIFELVNQNIFQFSSILNKTILLLAIQNNKEQVQIREQMINLIKLISVTSFSNKQLKSLLRLCFGGSNKLLIFSNKMPESQQSQNLADSVLENDHDLINIFFESQLNLVNKYSFKQGLEDFITIFNSLLEDKDPYIYFKDYNSSINIPITFQIQKGFTLYFEIQFINQVNQGVHGFQDSQDTIPTEIKQQQYEIITLYSEKNQQKLSGIKIMISQRFVQLRQFKFLNKQDILGPVVQNYEINIPESLKYNYQINYINGYFTIYVNDQLIKNEQKKQIEINQIMQIDLGKSMEATIENSQIFATEMFEYQKNIFRGKMFNFILTHHVQNGQIFEQQNNPNYLIQFSKFNKVVNPYVVFDKDMHDLFEINDTIKNKECRSNSQQFSSIFWKQISNVQDILKHSNIQSMILLLFTEILQQSNMQEYENQISNLLNTLLNKIILYDDETQRCFFKQEFNSFINILLQLTQKVKINNLLEILDKFNEKLCQSNKKNYLIFTNQIIYNFSLFNNILKDEVALNNYFLSILQKYNLSFENVIDQIKINTNLGITNSKSFFEFLNCYIIQPFYKNIKIKHENLFYKFVNDMQLFAKLFQHQNLNFGYLDMLKKYFQQINQKFPQAMKINLNKYPQNALIIQQKNDVLCLAALLNACKKKSYLIKDSCIYWNYINLLIYIEELHLENLPYNPKIVNSLINEILQDNLCLDQQNQPIITTIIQEIKNINSFCVIINVFAFLILNNNIQILDNKLKVFIINQISIKLKINFQTLDLLEISNNSMIELVFESLLFRDLSDDSKSIYQSILKQKISSQHLNVIDLGRLIKIYQQIPEIFFSLFNYLKIIIQNQKVNNYVIVYANLIKLLNIIKKDCFAKDQVSDYKKECSNFLDQFMDLFQQKNFFKFNLKKKQKENSSIENQLICGGLFGLFTEIFKIAIQNQSQEFVIDNIQKLLKIYLEEMNKKTDDSQVQELYGLFNYSLDKNGVKFPIIVKIFQKININLQDNKQKQIEEIQEIISYIEQNQEKQFKGNNTIFQAMLDEFWNQSSITKIEDYQNYLQCKYEEYKKNQTGIPQRTQYKSEILYNSCDSTQNSSKRNVDESFIVQQNLLQGCQIKLYVDQYLSNDVQSMDLLKKYIQALNSEILEQKESLTKDYKIRWQHSNLVDYENKIIFKKQINEKNQGRFQQQYETNIIFFSIKQDRNYNAQECICGTLKNIFNIQQEVIITINQFGIKFQDPLSNSEIIISQQNCKITIMQYQSQEISFLIKQFDQSYQNFYFLIIQQEDHFKQLKKHFKNLELIKTKSQSEIKKNLSSKWQQGQLSNYQYIFLLNSHSGRNLLDRNNYFILPWTTVNFNNNSLKINRTFSQSIFNQKSTEHQGYFHSNEAQLKYFLSKGQKDDSVNQTQISQPDEKSINESKIERKISLIEFMNELQKFGECLPEFYSNPQFFQEFQFPNWVLTKTPEEFIYIMRAYLESRYVQEALPCWIDLIFGYQKQNEIKNSIQLSIDRQQNKQKINGQTVKQIFAEKHLPRKIFHNYFGDQPQIKMTTKRLLYQGDEKIISVYYYSCQQFILITESGTAIILDVNDQLIQKMSLETDCLIMRIKKKLETTQLLSHQLISYIDFDNQNFTDKQESQFHIIESEKLNFFQSYTIFFIIGGYSNGEFRSYKGNNLNYKKYNTVNNSNVQCLKICHARCLLLIGQEDGDISLWKITRDYEMSNTPFLIISSHVYSITNIDCSTSQILSVDLINEVHIHYYNGQLLKKIQLPCYGKIMYCQISYTMNLYIFLNSFNKLMAYNQDGQIYIHPIEIPQKINNIIPFTPFSSQFIYTTDSGIYFDDIFIIKLKQDGVVLEKNQDKKIYDQNFSFIKAVQGKKLLLSENSVNYITSTQIIFQQSEISQMRFQTVGCDNGNFWCLYNEEDILLYYDKKLQQAGLK